MLTRSRSDLRARLADPALSTPDVQTTSPGKSHLSVVKSTTAELAPRSGLAPHVDRTVELDFTFLIRQAQQLDANKVKRLMQAAERRIPRRLDRAVARRLEGLAAGDTAMVPFHVLRPGQAQLSFAHAGTKVEKFLGKLEGHTPEDLTALAGDLGLLEVPCLIGPGGRFAVIHDRHHHTSGLLALIGWTDMLTHHGQALHMGKPGPELATLQALFGSDAPMIQIKVTDNLSHLNEAEFMKAAESYLHRDTPSGGRIDQLPVRFSQLYDNPFRFLASDTKIKVERTGDGKKDFELETKNEAAAIWVKPPSAPDFIEFHVGKVFAAAFAQTGRSYDPSTALTAQDVDTLRSALAAARADPDHPSHEVLRAAVIKPTGVSVEDFKDHIKVGRKKGHVRLK